MTPERFRLVEALYHVARERTADERAALLADADPEIRQEVESLLAQRGGEFLDRPAIQNAPQLLVDSALTGLGVGASLGPYRIESKLGEGGMGVVYSAVDHRLRRVVAVKVLPRAFEQDPDRLRRFTNEARAASALNHPHILTVYDIGEANGVPFIAMEFIDGVTVRARLGQGPLPLGEALDVAIQTGLALSAAHEKGIVHRDLKPENVMIRHDGYVKVLDFGLAALRPSKLGGSSAISASAFETTVGGGGTPAYMAPEQIDGRATDVRSEMFSFGVLVCELTTGVNPFTKTTLLETWAAIARTPESAAQVVADLPPELARLITRLLAKRPDDRYPDMKQVVADLRAIRVAFDGWTRAPNHARRGMTATAWTVSWKTASAAAALALAVAGYVYMHRAPKLTDKDTIVLADFANRTGDPVFDETLRQGLAVQLGQSPFLSIVSDDRVRRALQLMGQPPTASLSDEVARDICVRTGSTAVVGGSIASLGTQYVLGLRAQNCATGDLLDQEQLQAARKEDVLNILSQLATQFRTRVGESLGTVRQHARPLEESSTASLDALKAYSASFRAMGTPTALSLRKRAVELDPGFAIAYSQLGFTYSTRGETVLGEESTRKAYELRDHATDRDRFFIMTIYDRQVTGNLEKEGETLRLWAQTYPRDPYAPGLTSGYFAAGTGQYELMIEEARKAIAINPDGEQVVPAYYNVVWGYVSLGRAADAEQALHQAMARADQPDAVTGAFHVAFLKADALGMQRQIELAKGKPDREEWLSNLQALTLARSARLDRARESARHAIELSSAAGNLERAGAYETAIAVWEAWYGNSAAAKRSAMHVLDGKTGRHVTYAGAVALAIAGDVARAETIANDLARRFPEDTSVRYSYLPTLRALAALRSNDPSRAIEVLRPAATYEFAQPGISFYGAGGVAFGAMYPTYFRGMSYLALRKGAEAAAEFQKILEHPGVVLEDPMGALARLQLARAWTMVGDVRKAKATYEELLRLWKEADPAIPVVSEARAEYVRLS
jgi:tetratricopeptide (TPR) repeat protein